MPLIIGKTESSMDETSLLKSFDQSLTKITSLPPLQLLADQSESNRILNGISEVSEIRSKICCCLENLAIAYFTFTALRS